MRKKIKIKKLGGIKKMKYYVLQAKKGMGKGKYIEYNPKTRIMGYTESIHRATKRKTLKGIEKIKNLIQQEFIEWFIEWHKIEITEIELD